MWTTLVVSLVLGAPPTKDAPAKAGEDRELKILARGVWAVRHKQPTQLVIRTAEELALAHGIDGKDAKEARFQTDVTADVAELLKIKAIDWNKQMLIVITAGPQPTSGFRIDILKLPIKNGTLTVHWKLNSPKPDANLKQMRTYPGQMVLTERFSGPIKFDPPAK